MPPLALPLALGPAGWLRRSEASARAGGFPAAVMRMGQIAGPAESELGQWNRQEWLPSIVASSVFLGALPGSLAMMDRVDWTPCETEASLVLEVVGAVDVDAVWDRVVAGDVRYRAVIDTSTITPAD